MRIAIVLLVGVSACESRLTPALAAQPAATSSSIPSTSRAATRPADMLPLVDGSIRYLPPAGWELVGKTDDNLKATYRTSDELGRLDINVTPYDRDIPDTLAGQMAMIIGKAIRDGAKKENRELLLQPRVEKDERFFLVLHDRMRSATGGVVDRLQLYRVMGMNLVHVAVNAFTESPDEAKKVHAVAQNLLADMRLTHGARRIVYPKSNLKIVTPVDWKDAKTDQPNGLVVTFTDPQAALDAGMRQIIVRARVLPKDARTDPAKRDALLNRMIDEERRLPPLSSLSTKDEQSVGDPKYLRQLRTTATQGDKTVRVETRYLVVGDSLVSVRSVSEESDESACKIADFLATGIRTIRE